MLARSILFISALALAVPAEPATLYLVRHGEKQGGDDPGLTEAGHRRAADLALLLGDAGIAHVFSSDYRRTRETAAPLAAALGLQIRIYDPRDLAAVADRLRCLEGNALVVGHSNTTPELVRLLGGRAEPMPEWEYDRVYQLRLDAGRAETVLLRLAPASADPE